MKRDYPPSSRKARSKRIPGKARFTHNSAREKSQADHDGSRINAGHNATSAKNPFPHKSNGEMRKKQKLPPKNENGHFPLDRKSRGRPAKIKREEYPEILARAEHLRMILKTRITPEPARSNPTSDPEAVRMIAERYSEFIQVNPEDEGKRLWDRMREPFLKARTEEEVINAIEQYGTPYSQQLAPYAGLIQKVIHERKFPKSTDAQVNFLADSIAALERVTPRRSRNICEAERKKASKLSDQIEISIKCACGYEGFTEQGICPQCEANPMPLTLPFAIERLTPHPNKGGEKP